MGAPQILSKILMLLLISLCLIRISAPANQTKEEVPRDQQITAEGFKIRVDVNLVATDVTVTGTAPLGLKAQDFILYDDGIAQQTSYFSHDQLPLAIAILIDRSISISRYLPVLQIAAISSLRRLKSEDQVALFSFGTELTKLNDLTEDRTVIGNKIGKIGIAGATNIFDSIYSVAGYLKENAPGRRRAIILISDNCHTVRDYSYTPNVCLIQLLETATTLYSIKIGVDESESVRAVMQLAEKTGGEVMGVKGPTSLKASLEKAMLRFRLQYTLGFNPINPGIYGSFHKLDVQFAKRDRCPKCRLLVRSGYYAGVSTPLPSPDEGRTPQLRSPQETDQLLIRQIIRTAVAMELDMPDVSFTVSTAEQKDSAKPPQIKVDLQIHPDAIDFAAVKNRREGKMHIAIFYADEKGTLLGYDWKTLDRQLSEEAVDRSIKDGIPFSTIIPLMVQNQILKIVVYDEENDKVGSKLIQLHNAIKSK
jgi:Ca-activated chloride channel family protein